MNLVDVLILVVLCGFLVKGVLRGLLREVCSLLGLILGGVFAFAFQLPLAQLAQDSFGIPAQIALWGAFLVIFLTIVLIFAVLGFVLHRFVKMVFLGGINRLAGALFGALQGVVLLAIIIMAAGSEPAPAFARQSVATSHLAPPFITLGQTLLEEGRELIGHRP